MPPEFTRISALSPQKSTIVLDTGNCTRSFRLREVGVDIRGPVEGSSQFVIAIDKSFALRSVAFIKKQNSTLHCNRLPLSSSLVLALKRPLYSQIRTKLSVYVRIPFDLPQPTYYIQLVPKDVSNTFKGLLITDLENVAE